MATVRVSMSNLGPNNPVSEYIDSTKYRLFGETFKDKCARISNHLKDNDEHFDQFKDILQDMRFLPGGRIQAACGAARKVTPYNCYVSGKIEDDLCGTAGIMSRATEAAQTMRMGGGIGYDFSPLRPRGDLIKSLDSKASGPVSFMEIYNAVCNTIASAGHRRGAQMGVLRVDHPDIQEFIHAKHNERSLRGFNISIAVNDLFMQSVRDGTDFDLVFNGTSRKRIDARSLWEDIMRSTWDWAEPGVLFVDRINSENNLWYCEDIRATNPCGEQPLPPFGACLLGSFNLARYIEAAHEGKWGFALEKFKHDIPIVVRAMDNVVDRAIYPLPEQEAEAKNKRRMGLGITGYANAIEAIGFPYGSEEAQKFLSVVLSVLNITSYHTSVSLAIEKGPFPAFQSVSYGKKGFASKLPEDLKALIKENGIRNSHLTSIAPTGTISLSANNVSSGIEPVWQKEYDREIQTFDGPVTHHLYDYGVSEFGTTPRTVAECTLDDHISTLVTASIRVDSAVSKTCNVPKNTPWETFKEAYFKAWEGGAKGITTYTIGGERRGILEVPLQEEGQACEINEFGERSCE